MMVDRCFNESLKQRPGQTLRGALRIEGLDLSRARALTFVALGRGAARVEVPTQAGGAQRDLGDVTLLPTGGMIGCVTRPDGCQASAD